jgi:hypothetical protein
MQNARQPFGTFRLIILLLVAAAALTATGLTIWAAEPNTERLSADDLERRGKELRAELQRTYESLRAARKLSGGGTDMTDAVLPYIQTGMSFSDAETILRNAGFLVEPHPDLNSASNPHKPRDWYAVVAVIDPFDAGFMRKVSLYVSLLPASSGDYSSVAKVSATIFTSMP